MLPKYDGGCIKDVELGELLVAVAAAAITCELMYLYGKNEKLENCCADMSTKSERKEQT